MDSQWQNDDAPIVLIDDEEPILRSYEITLKMGGFTNILPIQESAKALERLQASGAKMVFLDLTMPVVSGEELLPELLRHFPETPVLVVTGNDDVETAVRCMKAGATDYLIKPISQERLLTSVKRTLETLQLKAEANRLKDAFFKEELKAPEAFSEIITNNPRMLKLFRYIEAVAPSPEPLFIMGETGVGKELFAKAAHKLSGKDGAFVAVNIAGVDDTLFDDMLFGHDKGAYTGADTPRAGLIEKAEGGTLFLDEIGDLSPTMQMKLLRLIQEREYYPLGRDTPQMSNARIIAATNRQAKALRKGDVFRTDLFYRLTTHLINVPPLRERQDDIPLLIEVFREQAKEEMPAKQDFDAASFQQMLFGYKFPGNVRELRSLVFDAMSHESSKESLQERIDLHTDTTSAETSDKPKGKRHAGQGLVLSSNLPTIEEAKTLLIDEALRRAGGNKTLAAKMLGITRQALNKRLNKG